MFSSLKIEGLQELNASQSRTLPMNVQDNKQLVIKFSSAMIRGTKAKQSTWLHGNNHVSEGFSSYSDKLDLSKCKRRKCTMEENKKVAHENEELDPEIEHLIDTFWEVDNCPLPLFGEITLEGTKKESAPPRKLH